MPESPVIPESFFIIKWRCLRCHSRWNTIKSQGVGKKPTRILEMDLAVCHNCPYDAIIPKDAKGVPIFKGA